MKTERKCLWGTLFMFGLAILAGLTARQFFPDSTGGNLPPVESNSPVVAKSTCLPRESITFVLGQDEGVHNRYYSKALHYYRMHPETQTENLVTELRSLQEVRDYLEAQPPQDGRPWGQVNLVVHSNAWTGLEAPVVPGGQRTTPERLHAAMSNGDFPPIPDGIVDAQTEIMVYGCALGRNQPMLDALSEAFGGKGDDLERPRVRSSRFFVQYASEGPHQRPTRCFRYLTDFRYAFYKTGYRPADYQLIRQLKVRYPGDTLAYEEALQRTRPRFPGDLYHHRFRIPVVWLVTYDKAEDRPDFSTPDSCLAWLNAQTALQATFERYALSEDQFTWTFQKIRHEMPNGKRVPAVKLIGLCDVICVLQPLTEPDGETPLAPAISDARFYASSQAPCVPAKDQHALAMK